MIEPFSEPCDLEERDRTRLIHQILESKGVLVFNTSGSRNSRGLSDLDLIDGLMSKADNISEQWSV